MNGIVALRAPRPNAHEKAIFRPLSTEPVALTKRSVSSPPTTLPDIPIRFGTDAKKPTARNDIPRPVRR